IIPICRTRLSRDWWYGASAARVGIRAQRSAFASDQRVQLSGEFSNHKLIQAHAPLVQLPVPEQHAWIEAREPQSGHFCLEWPLRRDRTYRSPSTEAAVSARIHASS